MKYLRRMMSFLAARLIIFTLCVALIVCAFYMAYNMGNAFMLIDEGMEKRVSVVLTREHATDLNDYFTAGFLEADPVLAYAFSDMSPYIAYNITGFEHDVEISDLRAWPWSDEVLCTVTEHVSSITGTVKANYVVETGSKPATWSDGRYRLMLKKQSNGQWKIAAMQQDPSYHDVKEESA